MNYLYVFLTSVLSVIALFISAKLMGRRQISQMSLFDYICGITIGSNAAELATSEGEFLKPLIAIAVMTVFQISAAYVSDKSIVARKIITGSPKELYSDGTLYRKNFALSRLGLDEFLSQLRLQGFTSLCDIQSAILEPNGRISFVPTPERRPATNADMGIQAETENYLTPLIMDGSIQVQNLSGIGKTEKWLFSQLKKQGFTDAKKVFYAVSDGENLTVFKSE